MLNLLLRLIIPYSRVLKNKLKIKLRSFLNQYFIEPVTSSS